MLIMGFILYLTELYVLYKPAPLCHQQTKLSLSSKKCLFVSAKGQEAIFLSLAFAAAPVDMYILGMSLIDVLCFLSLLFVRLYNGHALFCDSILMPQGPIHVYMEFILLAVSVAVTLLLLLSCATWPTICPSPFVEPFSFLTNCGSKIHTSLLQYKRTGKEMKEKQTQHVHFAWSLQWIVAWTQRLLRSLKCLHPVKHRH